MSEKKLIAAALACFVWQKKENIETVDVKGKKVFFLDGDIFIFVF